MRKCFLSVKYAACLTRDAKESGSQCHVRIGATPGIVGWFAGHKCKMTVSDITNRLNYCEYFTVYTNFMNVTAGRIIKAGRLQDGDS
jgi:hypothetical protein